MENKYTERERLSITYLQDDKIRATLARHLKQFGCEVSVGNRLNLFDPYRLGGKHVDIFIDIYHDAIITLVTKITEGVFEKQSEMGAVVNFLKNSCWFNWSNHKDNPNKKKQKGGGEDPYMQDIDINSLEYLQGTDDFVRSIEYKNLQAEIKTLVEQFPNEPPVWFATRLQLMLAGDSNEEIAQELKEDKEYTRRTNYDVKRRFRQMVEQTEGLEQLVKEFINTL